MRLLTILRKKPFCNNVFYFLIGVIFFIISYKYPLFYIVLGGYLIYLVIKTKLLLPILISILIFLSRILIDRVFVFDVNDDYDIYVNDIIDENRYEAYVGYKKLLLYDNNHNVKPGDKYTATIKINDIEEKSYDTDFDYEYYLKSKGIYKSGIVVSKEFKRSGFSLNSIKYYYSNYLKDNLCEESYLYVKALVFGDNDLENDIKDSYSVLGLSHILAISGMHIVFLFNIISFILLKVFNYYKKGIPIVIITLFVILIGAPISSVRAVLFLIIGSLNKGRTRYGRIDILSISCLIMLLVNPFMLFNSGFILSFLVSFILIFKNSLFKSSGSLLIDTYKMYILLFLITLPFVTNISNRVSILSILLSPILSIVLGYILLPISYILGLLPILDFVFKYVFIFINNYIVNLGSLLPIFHLQSFNLYMIIVYYVVFILFIIGLYRGRGIYYLGLLVSYIVMLYGIKYVDFKGRVTFINCGQGDSALVELPYNKGIMVIDCFNSIDYLKRRGIDYIDYLVLTHSDSDHVGDYVKVLDEFKVGMIYYPIYDERFDKLLAGYKNKKGISDINNINSNVFDIEVLGPIKEYSDVNSNSIVLKLRMYDTTFLFTGDMTIEEEYDLIDKYDYILDSDILKVGHHGSNTSSSKEFLEYVSPIYSIISVGKNNSYGLPNNDVVKRLEEESKVYMTKDCGNIDIYVYKEKVWISTYR
ncbi:MAG: DNA internalization-related competence protein ComEC/Rec2 [Acholeplasmatales bacterium]|nr:DNA internalization-related competence protein ComEC/Rec2 [Acholeplasmatales bacterium]